MALHNKKGMKMTIFRTDYNGRRLCRWYCEFCKYTKPSRIPSAEAGAGSRRLYVNANKTCFIRVRDISTLNGSPLKLIEKFMYFGSSVLSTEGDVNIRLVRIWTAIDWLWIVWKSDLSHRIKLDFFQAAVVSVLLNRCTTRMLKNALRKS